MKEEIINFLSENYNIDTEDLTYITRLINNIKQEAYYSGLYASGAIK